MTRMLLLDNSAVEIADALEAGRVATSLPFLLAASSPASATIDFQPSI